MSDAYGSFVIRVPYKTREEARRIKKIINNIELESIYYEPDVIVVKVEKKYVEVNSPFDEVDGDAYDTMLEALWSDLHTAGFEVDARMDYEVDGELLRGSFNEYGRLEWYELGTFGKFPVGILRCLESIGEALKDNRIKDRLDFVNQLSLRVEELVDATTELRRAEALDPEPEHELVDFHSVRDDLYELLGAKELTSEAKEND